MYLHVHTIVFRVFQFHNDEIMRLQSLSSTLHIKVLYIHYLLFIA